MSPLVTLLVLGLLILVVMLMLLWAIASTVGPGFVAWRRPARASKPEEAAERRPLRGEDGAAKRGEERGEKGGKERGAKRSSERGEERGEKRQQRGDAESPLPPSVSVERVSNDDLRGARANRPAPRRDVPEDAFERFLRSGRDDER